MKKGQRALFDILNTTILTKYETDFYFIIDNTTYEIHSSLQKSINITLVGNIEHQVDRFIL